MNCPRCGAQTRLGQKFCAECGLALASSCPNCAAPFEPGQKFCAECGTALEAPTASVQPTSAPQASAERRYVSVLFADLVGFTSLSEQHDPEEVRDLLSRYFDVARTVIEGYGGSVEKFIGDAVMAVWGAPVAREDDAERAVRAALELVARVRELRLEDQALALRAGVVSGEAAVTPGRVGEGMVAGDIVNTASRIQSVAPAGVVLVGESTQQATNASIVYEAAGEQLLKGKETPVPAWRAVRVVARIGGQGREEGLEPPFVGRGEEFRLLTDQLHGSEREGRLRVVAISGQAGLGKTRLVWELEKYLDGLAADRIFYWHQGRSPSYGEGVTYWALGEMVRRRAGIAESEDAESTRDKLRDTLDTFVADPDERRRLEPALGALLGIDNADWAQREQLFSAWRTFFERIAERGPTVLVFEDLQWADEGLLDFIEHLLDWSRDKPILIVTLARPELLERRPNFGLGRHAFVAIHLEPLTDGAMAELLRGLVPTMAEDDLARIVARAEGVPLYAVETIRALIDGGHLVRRDAVYEPAGTLPTLDIPPTLRALIASRLDALDPSDKSLLQGAAVVGIVFSPPAVAAVSGRSAGDVEARLRALMPNELVTLETDPRSPERGQYRFMQALLREVAYGSLSRPDRKARHLAAARYLETVGDDEVAGVLATHYLEAYRASPDADESAPIAAQARIALKAAAERAEKLHSYMQAMNYFEQAMAVTFDPAEINLLRTRAADNAHTLYMDDRAFSLQRDAIKWSAENGRGDEALALQATLAQWLLETSAITEAFELLENALASAPAGATPGKAAAYGQLARANLFQSRGDAAMEAIEEAIDVAVRLHLSDGFLHLLITKSWALGQVGRLLESNALLIGTLAYADRDEDVWPQIRGRFNLSGQLLIDDPRRGLEVALQGIDICEGIGWNSASMVGNAAGCALILGDIDEVLKLEQRADKAATAMGALMYLNAAGAVALRGDWDGVNRRVAIVEESVASSTSSQDAAELLNGKAFIAFASGQMPDSRRMAIESIAKYEGAAASFASMLIAQRAAIYMHDTEALRADAAWLRERSFGARWAERVSRSAEAALMALEERHGESVLLYREVIDEWRDADLPFDLALTLLERSVVLPMTDREVARGRDEARALLDGLGATGLADRLLASAPNAAPAGAGANVAAAVTPDQERAAQATR